jgi:hypothetical protein
MVRQLTRAPLDRLHELAVTLDEPVARRGGDR